jgi:2-polyprenyl-3-methyl-5-hydroxy-6-metoxy-1,4-benzoquinol methylase
MSSAAPRTLSDPQSLSFIEYAYSDADLGCAHSYIAPKLLELLGTGRRLRILDLGCGNGSLSHLISTRGHEVVGVDQSESGIALAQRHFPDCQFLQASIYSFSHEHFEGTFDVVTSVEVIEHLLYPRELVRVAKKMLKPNGRLMLSTPYHGYIKYLALASSGKMDRHMTFLWDGGHVKFFSPKTLTALLRSEGFPEPSFHFVGRLPFLWKSMLCSSVNPGTT